MSEIHKNILYTGSGVAQGFSTRTYVGSPQLMNKSGYGIKAIFGTPSGRIFVFSL